MVGFLKAEMQVFTWVVSPFSPHTPRFVVGTGGSVLSQLTRSDSGGCVCAGRHVGGVCRGVVVSSYFTN